MTWAKSTMRDGAESATERIPHSMRSRLAVDVLELAYGTGEWTIRLADVATRVVGVDAAPEMRELAPAKLQDAGESTVELRVDDLFSWVRCAAS